jgi:hypothetical protein
MYVIILPLAENMRTNCTIEHNDPYRLDDYNKHKGLQTNKLDKIDNEASQ